MTQVPGRIRFSMSALLGAVVFIAATIAALRHASAFVASLAFLIVLSALSFAILAALFRPQPARLFWAGFALFGWIFLFIFIVLPGFDVDFDDTLTSPGFKALYQVLGRAQAPRTSNGELAVHALPGGRTLIDGKVVSESQFRTLVQKELAGGKRLVLYQDSRFDPSPIWKMIESAGIPRGSWSRSPLEIEPDWNRFKAVGQAAVTLLFALLGGLLARVFLAGSQPQRSKDREPIG